MPFIEMYIPEGTVTDESKRRLHERVARQVLEVEGATYDESPKARAITWMLIHEVAEGNFSVGSEPLSSEGEARVLTRVVTPHGALDDERRAEVVRRVNHEVVEALGEEFADPTKSICLVGELTFSGGGIVVTFDDVMRWVGLDPETREPLTAAQTPA
ncbi:MAG: 4-oxalocrotonate tautomerase family protein [Gaiellaceae bacterium]